MDYKGENSVRIALTLELLNVVKNHAGSDKQKNGFWLMKHILTVGKDFWLKELGKEEYQRQLEHYSKTNIEQRTERKLKEQERRIRAEAKQKIEAIRAEAYATQSEVAKIKSVPHRKRIMELEQKRLKFHTKLQTMPPNDNPEHERWLEAKIKEIDDELKVLKDEQRSQI